MRRATLRAVRGHNPGRRIPAPEKFMETNASRFPNGLDLALARPVFAGSSRRLREFHRARFAGKRKRNVSIARATACVYKVSWRRVETRILCLSSTHDEECIRKCALSPHPRFPRSRGMIARSLAFDLPSTPLALPWSLRGLSIAWDYSPQKDRDRHVISSRIKSVELSVKFCCLKILFFHRRLRRQQESEFLYLLLHSYQLLYLY